ncbi:hypothetical protein [Marinobacter sp. F4216]|uniref:hypothetical protein n=1 Tax=Marinobacter sp. F4216 TaxID=2874281 RepID=UPI001CBAC34D|nr:hypothetical protein [Marinobacter sp. F4216]MBZ2169845.1 hypothetical protein [Marinobacter sp. F4216]
MCRIDAPYENLSLDEKPAPSERLTQALEEHGISGTLKSLFIKHFSGNWPRIFGSADGLEDALTSSKEKTSEREKAASILSSDRFARELAFQLIAPPPAGIADNGLAVFHFAQDVAQTYFSDSPYSLFQCVNATTLPFYRVVSRLYGEEFCFDPALFDDPALIAEGDFNRNELLWSFFNTWSWQDDGNQNELAAVCDAQIKNLISAASLELLDGPPTFGAHKFLQGIRFLKTWVASDAAAGRLKSTYEGAFLKLDLEWSELYSRVRSIGASNGVAKEESDLATAWLDKTKIRLQEVFCLGLDLTNADDGQVDQWASQLNSCFISLSTPYPAILKQSREEWDARENEYLNLTCSKLTSYQIEAWIKWSIQQDIESEIKESERTRAATGFYGAQSRKWWASGFRATWKALCEEALSKLDIKSKLTVLSGTFYHHLPDETAYSEFQPWWDSLLEGLIQDSEFPTALIPQWALAAKGRIGNDLVLPYIDKSIGLLRGKLSSGPLPSHHEQLEKLLSSLSSSNPKKELRHRLMLMRSSPFPLCDESLSRFSPVNSEKAVPWHLPLKDVARNRFENDINETRSFDREQHERAEIECYQSFTLELVEFCLSRLRLRKGQKPKDGSYENNQATEQSPIWRQGYLKALLELGLDPNGKAHKTLYFTKQFDPDEHVRSVAKESYRAVRREAKKPRNIQDFKRGLIAAEWWLLMTQRLELDLDVNHEEALKTRRRLLRNP